ncbi:hypothetical protein ACH4C2_19110 [Streptomyces sp. NPDC018057]|uniref:DUF7919 family protein n=1 Tax=unclassified Streptomyces TaxID=2593676 RepID=UPI0037BC2E23
MFYEDLSAYAYLDHDAFTDRESGFHALWYRPAYARLNVGWLEAGRPYPTGAVPPGFVDRLRAVQEVQWMNVCLGVHACDLCPAAGAPEGNGEIRALDPRTMARRALPPPAGVGPGELPELPELPC